MADGDSLVFTIWLPQHRYFLENQKTSKMMFICYKFIVAAALTGNCYCCQIMFVLFAGNQAL